MFVVVGAFAIERLDERVHLHTNTRSMYRVLKYLGVAVSILLSYVYVYILFTGRSFLKLNIERPLPLSGRRWIITQGNFYSSNTSSLSSAAKPAPGGVYSAPTPPSVHGGGGHGSSSHGSPGTGAAAAAVASKPLYGAQQTGVSSAGGVSGGGVPGGMGGMQQAGQQQPQQVGGEVRIIVVEGKQAARAGKGGMGLEGDHTEYGSFSVPLCENADVFLLCAIFSVMSAHGHAICPPEIPQVYFQKRNKKARAPFLG